MRRQLVRTTVAAVVVTGVALAGFSSVAAAPTAPKTVEPGSGAVVRKIKRLQHTTWRWQRLMGVRRTPNRKRYLRVRDREYRIFVMRQWAHRAARAKRRAHNPPNERAWRCLQRFEGSWRDPHDPYWGGLQMDKTFMRMYAPRYLLRRGWANNWTPIEQMWVAERAIRAGRGFYPWPNTGRMCGLI